MTPETPGQDPPEQDPPEDERAREQSQGPAPAEPAGEPAAEQPGEPAAEQPATPPAEESPSAPAEPERAEPAAAAEEPATRAEEPRAEEPRAEAPPAAEEPAGEPPAEEEPVAPAEEPPAAEEPPRERRPAGQRPRAGREGGATESTVVPGADLEVDIVPEGVDPLARQEQSLGYDEDVAPPTEAEEAVQEEAPTEESPETIVAAAIDLGADARYRATGKRKTAIARVILRPGAGSYKVNGRALEEHFPRVTLQRNIRQPLEAVGYDAQMDVVARLHGGGVSAQAGALRHGISRALLEADPNLRGELKRRGFLTRDARAKERKKAGLKKARKRPQFSKR